MTLNLYYSSLLYYNFPSAVPAGTRPSGESRFSYYLHARALEDTIHFFFSTRYSGRAFAGRHNRHDPVARSHGGISLQA